jgi:TPR repeat protein
MERGHISGARLIFEHLALRQSALGAFALAQTYDEKFLKGFFVKGLEPDPTLAAKWYRRAAELGTQFAEKR